MRIIVALLGLGLLAGLSGCADGGRLNLLRPTGTTKDIGKDVAVKQQVPLKEDLVAYLDNNAARIPGIESNDIGLTCYANSSVGIPISGWVRGRGPRDFRLVAKALGNEEVDLGSNDQEFWYWIRRGAPYQFFCSYQALEEGRVKDIALPFQPDWVLEAIGMGRYGPADKYELQTTAANFKLIERTKSPQGVPVKKVIVFNSKQARADEPQVTDYLVVDERTGKEICSAKIKRRQILGGAELAREIELRWPQENLKLVLHLDNVRLTQNMQARFFTRPRLNGVQAYDLASGPVERLQPAGGIPPRAGAPQ
jgi:hypothetical protein